MEVEKETEAEAYVVTRKRVKAAEEQKQRKTEKTMDFEDDAEMETKGKKVVVNIDVRSFKTNNQNGA